MSKFYICDRCGKTIDKSYSSLKEKVYGGMVFYGETSKLDLCKSCTKEFHKWMKTSQ